MGQDVIKQLRSWVVRYHPYGVWGLFLVSLFCLYGDTLATHILCATDPNIFNDDARQQVFPFYRYGCPAFLTTDYISDYYLSCFPTGYRCFYTALARLIDPMWISKCLPYPLLLLTLWAMGISGWKLGGKMGAWGAVALCLGNAVFLGRLTGGLPRSFAFPLLAWAIAALVCGKMRWLSIVVCLGAAFYPAAGVAAGLSFAFALFVLSPPDRGDAETWSVRERILRLCLVGGVALMVVLPTAFLSRAYGPLLSPDDTARYPELGPGGRYQPEDRAPYPNVARDIPSLAAMSAIGYGKPICSTTRVGETSRGRMVLNVFLLASLACWLVKMRASRPARRMAVFFLSVLVAYGVSVLFAPYLYLPQRYLAYTIPLLTVLLVTTSVEQGLPRRWFATDRAHGYVMKGMQGLCIGGLLLGWGGRGAPLAGFTVHIPEDVEIYRRISELPAPSLIAGWPDDIIENVPYLSRRAALVARETHQAFHRAYGLEMRRRTRALIDAYFATNTCPLVRLKQEFGVTHLLLNTDHHRAAPPRYFAPFDAWIRQTREDARGQPVELVLQMDAAAIYREGPYVLFDLSRIRPRAPVEAITPALSP